MVDEAASVRGIDWRETFPLTHLFRAFRVAIHPSKLIIALVALGCLWCGGLILDQLWPQKSEVTAEERLALFGDSATPRTPDPGRIQEMLGSLSDLRRRGETTLNEDQVRLVMAGGDASAQETGIFSTFFNYEVTQANNVLMFRGGPLSPFESVWSFVAVGPLWLWAHHWLFALIYTAWFLLIWSVFGGAISRIAAVHVARDEKISVRHAMSFSVAKVLSFIFAPVIPVFIVLVIGLIIAVASWVLLHIPYVGPFAVGLTFFLALIGGFIVTLVLLGTLGGFNLMYPTVAVEGSDSFDAISRSFSYVFARPWRMLCYTMVSVIYGAVCYLFVRFFVWLMLAVTWFFMNWFLHGQPAKYWPMMWPQPADPLSRLRYIPDYDHLKGTEAAAAGLIQFWVYLVIGLIGAFAISFYFSANTIIYYLMRREVDATDLDDVYVEETDDDLDASDASPGDAAAAQVVADEVPPPPETPGEPAPGA